MEETTQPELSPRAVTTLVISIVVFTFICYLTIGIPIAVLPGYVHNKLGFSPAIAGVVISVQYFATLSNRTQSGRMADSVGAKKTVISGLIACGFSGLCLPLAASLHTAPWASLAALLIGRVILGFGESWVGTGAIVWGVGRVGAANMARVISWNGINTYGAIAIGAPLGVWLNSVVGLVGMGVFITGLSVFGLLLALPKPPPPLMGGKPMAIRHVASRVAPFGIALMAGSIGFGTIATFVTLFYASRHWEGPALALTAFGFMFVAIRLLFTNAIGRFGGFRVGICCLAVETLGLAILALAPSANVALLGAAGAGGGFALLFPALGVEAVSLVPPASRGSALGIFNVFLDLSLGATGPVAGLLVASYGYSGVYAFAAFAAGCGTGMAVWLWKRNARRTAPATQLP